MCLNVVSLPLTLRGRLTLTGLASQLAVNQRTTASLAAKPLRQLRRGNVAERRSVTSIGSTAAQPVSSDLVVS